jgi:hypothetical protein
MLELPPSGAPYEAGFVGCPATGQLVAMGRGLPLAHRLATGARGRRGRPRPSAPGRLAWSPHPSRRHPSGQDGRSLASMAVVLAAPPGERPSHPHWAQPGRARGLLGPLSNPVPPSRSPISAAVMGALSTIPPVLVRWWRWTLFLSSLGGRDALAVQDRRARGRLMACRTRPRSRGTARICSQRPSTRQGWSTLCPGGRSWVAAATRSQHARADLPLRVQGRPPGFTGGIEGWIGSRSASERSVEDPRRPDIAVTSYTETSSSPETPPARAFPTPSSPRPGPPPVPVDRGPGVCQPGPDSGLGLDDNAVLEVTVELGCAYGSVASCYMSGRAAAGSFVAYLSCSFH